MMRDVITKGTGGQAGISGMNVAGKTGTTNDTIDLTFYGYTPYYTAGIWMGYDTQKEIKNAGNAHLKIWRTVMSQIHNEEGLANKNFEKPDGLTSITYCTATGKTPTDLCSQDYYGKGTHSDLATTDFGAPSGACDLHKSYTVCKESGKIASPNCPADCQMEIVLAVNGDKILSKPSEIPEGKMDVIVNEACDIQHAQAYPPVINDPYAGTTPDGNIDATIPDDTWGDEDFGIQ